MTKRPAGLWKKAARNAESRAAADLDALRTDPFNDLFQDFFPRPWVFEILTEQFNDVQPFIHASEHVRFYCVSYKHVITPRDLNFPPSA